MTDAERNRALDFFLYTLECTAAGDSAEHNDIEYMFKAFTKLNCHRNALKTLLLDLLADVESCGGPCGRPELLARIDAACGRTSD